jgi:hypothetical protein
MLAYDTSTFVVLLSAFFAVAFVAAVLAVSTTTHVVVTNRRARLARHESIRTYYRGHLLTH